MRALPRMVHPSRLYALTLAALVGGVLASTPARAATYTWGNNGNGGDGNWTSGTWWNGSAQTWSSGNPDSAIFAGTPGTVTLGGNVTSGSVLFTVDGFTIAAGNTLTLNSGFTANGSATVNSNVALGANQSWSVASGKTLTLGGVVSSGSTLTYGGSGTYALNGINTNSGNLTIDTATVSVATGATLYGSGLGWAGRTVTLQNGGTLIATNWANGAGNLWGQIGDAANNIIFGSGGGTFTMTGTVMDSTVNKGFTVNAGVTGNFTVSTGVSSTWSGSYSGRDFTVNGTLAFGGGGDFTTSRIISGGGGVTKNGTGTVTLTGANNFTGQTLVKSGTLALAGGQFGTGSGINTSRAINIGPSSGDNGTFTVSSGTISQASAGLMIGDSGTGTFSQSGGSVTIGSSGLWLGDSSSGVGTANFSGGTFTSTGATTVVATRNRGTINVSGTANVILSTLQMGHSAGGTSQIATVNLDGGSLTVDQVTKANGTASFYFNSGTITARSSNASFMTGLNTAEIKAGGAIIDTGAFAITIGQPLNQNAGSTGGGLTKLGSGALTLSAVNGFTGALNVNSGTLVATASTSSNASALGAGGNAINVASGATLLLSTNNRTAGYHTGAVTISGGTITMNTQDNSLGAGNTITFNTAAGAINGSGQWRFRGGATVRVLPAANGSTIGVTTLDLYDGNEVFNVDSGAALTVSSLITNDGGGTLTKSGSGTLVLSSASSSYNGSTTVRAGSLVAGANAPSAAIGAFGNASSAIVVGDGSTAASDAPSVLIGGAFTVGRAISIGSVSNGAAYTPVLGGTNTSGTATFGGNITLNTTASAYTGLNLRAAPGGTVEFTGGTWTTNNKPITVGAAGSTGTVRISNPLATTGGVMVSAGTLQIGAANAIGDTTPVTLAGGTLDVGGVADTIGTLSGSTAITGAVGSALTVTQASNTTFSGTIGGSVALVKAGASTLSLSAANTLTGGVTVASGSLALVGGANRLPTAAAVVLGSSSTSGVLVLGDGSAAANQTLAALTVTGSGGRVVGGNASASTLTLDIAGSNTYAGGLGGAGTNENSLVLVKTGAGSLTLSGPTTYTGNTTVSAGSLVLASGVSLASPTTTVSSGATLGGSGTGGATIVSSGGILAPGTSGVGTLTLGNLTFGATVGNTATVSIPTTGSSSIPATLRVNGDVVTNGGAGSVTFAFGSLSLVPTGTYSLMTYTGSLASGTTPFAYTGSLSGRQGVSFDNPTGALNLVITNAYPLWTGVNSGLWSGPNNWKLNTDNAPTSFQGLDTVVFGDGVTTGTVTISGSNVNPVTTTFSANSQNYLLDATGGFGISTGNLIKSGSATVTIANANSFDGGTLVSGGSLVLTGSGGLGTGSVTVSGGALALTNAGGLGTGSIAVSGGLLAVTGSGQLGSNAVSLTSGTIQAGSDTALGTGTVSLSGGVLSSDSSTPRSLANRVAVGGNATLGSAATTGALTLSGTLDLGAGTPTLTMPSNVTLSGAVVNGGFVKAGGGTLTASGSNAYSGGTTLSAGAIRVGNNAALGSGGLTLSSGTLSSDSGTARSLANAVTVNGNVSLGDVTNAGNLTLSGGVDLGGGTRQLTLASNATLSGIVANGGLSKAGSGLLTLSNANSYSAGTTLSAGTIAIGNNAALGSGAVTLSAGTLRSDSATARSLANALVFTGDATFGDATNNGALSFSGTVGLGGTTRTITTDSSLTLSGTVSNGGITKAGAGVLTLSAANSYTGKTAINAGTVSIAADSGLGAAPGSPVADQLSFGGGTLRITAGSQTLAANRGITLGAGGGTIDTSSISGAQTTTISGVIAGTGPLTLRSTGDQSANGGGDGGRGIFLNATNTFSGTITVTTGFLSYVSDAALGNAANQIVLTGGGLLDNGSNIAMTHPIVISAGTSTFRTYGSASPTWSGAISGAAAVNRTDGGTLTLTGNLSGFTGTYDNQAGNTVLSGGAAGLGAGAQFRVSAGTVTFASGRLGSGTAVMNSGTLQWAGGNADGSVNIALVNGVTATLDTNGNNVTLTTSFGAGTSGNVTKTGGGTLTLTGTNTYTGQTLVRAGTLALAGGQFGNGSSNGSNRAINVGVSAGENATFTVSAGTLSQSGGAGLMIGDAGTGTFNQTGGSVTLGSGGFYLGDSAGGVGTANFSGGSFTSTGGNTVVATRNVGTVNISASANVTLSTLQMGHPLGSSTSSSTVNLNGGTLAVNQITKSNGTASFYFNSGTLAARGSSASFLTGLNTAEIKAGGAVIDTNGFAITIGQALGENAGSTGGGLTKLGSGTLTLAGVSTYTGTTAVQAGTLALGLTNAIPAASAITLGSAGARGILDLTTRDLTTASLTFTGLGGELPTGATGELFLQNLTTGTALVSAVSGSSAIHTTMRLATNASFAVTTSATLSLHGTINGTGTLFKTGSGTLTLHGANGWSGGTWLQQGGITIVGGNPLAFGTGTITLGDYTTLDLGGAAIDNTIVFASGTANVGVSILNSGTWVNLSGPGAIASGSANYKLQNTADIVFQGAVPGSVLIQSGGKGVFQSAADGSVSVNAGGQALFQGDVNDLVTSGSTTIQGTVLDTVTVNGGTTTISGNTAFGSLVETGSGAAAYTIFTGTVAGGAHMGSGGIGDFRGLVSGQITTDAGGAAILKDGFSSTGGSIQNEGSLVVDRTTNLTLAAPITGIGSLTKQGAATLTLSGTSTYSGGTVISAGTVALSSAGAIAGPVSLAASTALDISGASGNRTIGALSGTTGSQVLLGGNVLTVDDVTSTAFAGVISGSGGFTKAGAGTLTLSNVQTFTGAARVDAGTLVIGGTTTLLTASQIFVASGATLDTSAAGLTVGGLQTLGGSGTVAGGFTIADGATLSPGNSPGTISATGTTIWGGGGNYNWQIYTVSGSAGTGTGWDLLNSTGSLMITSAGPSPFNINMWSLSGLPNTTGNVSDFDPSVSYKFLIAEFAGGITGWDPAAFSLNTGAVNGTGGFTNDISGQGSFALARGDTVTGGNANQIYIVYAAVPEPGTLVLAGLGLAGAALVIRRRRRGHHSPA